MNFKMINQFEGLEMNLELCIVLHFFFLLELNNNAKSESLRILTPFFTVDYISVQQSTLICSPQVETKKKTKVPLFGLICIVDWTYCNVNLV